MRGVGGSTLRGGQTVFHGLRMWSQLLHAAMLFALFTTLVVPAWNLWRNSTGVEWYAAWMVTSAELKLALGHDPSSGQQVRFANGSRAVLSLGDVAKSPRAVAARVGFEPTTFRL